MGLPRREVRGIGLQIWEKSCCAMLTLLNFCTKQQCVKALSPPFGELFSFVDNEARSVNLSEIQQISN